MLQWRQAATRKQMPITNPPTPPTATTKLSPECPFKSARCRLTIIRIPKIEKPRDRLTKLIVVHIFRSSRRWNSRSHFSVFVSVPSAAPRLELQGIFIPVVFSVQYYDERATRFWTPKAGVSKEFRFTSSVPGEGPCQERLSLNRSRIAEAIENVRPPGGPLGASTRPNARFICSGSIDRLASVMSVAKYPYETRLDVLHPSLDVIDILKLAKTVDFQWFNQTLCKVNDSVCSGWDH
jgi:hypothetical protein